MAYDLVVKDALTVDGTGKHAYAGDVAGENRTIADLGKVDGEAARTIRADGQVVGPGFIDARTHYDAQVLWDPSARRTRRPGAEPGASACRSSGRPPVRSAAFPVSSVPRSVRPRNPATRDVKVAIPSSREKLPFSRTQVIFDPETVGPLALQTLDDIPGGGTRMTWVVVNGSPVVEHGKPTGEVPGRVLGMPGR